MNQLILRETRSLCPHCLKIIPAEIVQENRIYLQKECPEHGKFKVPHIWEQPGIFRLREELHRESERSANGLVLNVTTSCNLHCPFCYALAGDIPINDMSYEKIRLYLKRFKGNIVYLSGGEPTVREDLCEVIKIVKEEGFFAALFTNGKKLADSNYVTLLKEAGTDLVIMQFDTLKQEICEALRGKGAVVSEKLSAVENLGNVGIPVYLFTMVVKGRNDKEIKPLLSFAAEHPYVKILNFQPVWEVGRTDKYEGLSTYNILKIVQGETGLTDDDFIQSTRFTHYLSELLSSLRKKNVNTHPSCETKCYVVFKGKSIVPLTSMLPLREMADVLKGICKKYSKVPLFLRIAFASPLLFYHVSRAIIRNPSLTSWLASCGKSILLKSKGDFLISLPFTSIIVGAFPTAENIDLDMTNTCNLHSDLPDRFTGGTLKTTSACVRQILVAHQAAKDSRVRPASKSHNIPRNGKSHD